MKVFLDGTYDGYDWRSELIPILTCDYYNPISEGWEEDGLREEKEREKCDYILYVITSDIKSMHLIAKVVDDSNKIPDKIIFCILDEDMNYQMKHSLEIIKRLVVSNGCKLCKDLESVAKYLTDKKDKYNANVPLINIDFNFKDQKSIHLFLENIKSENIKTINRDSLNIIEMIEISVCHEFYHSQEININEYEYINKLIKEFEKIKSAQKSINITFAFGNYKKNKELFLKQWKSIDKLYETNYDSDDYISDYGHLVDTMNIYDIELVKKLIKIFYEIVH